MKQTKNETFFAPHLTVLKVKDAMDFYVEAFGAKLLRSWDNPDGSVHVAEMEINGALFHIHEVTVREAQLSPETVKGTTVLIGLFVPDPDGLIEKSFLAGGIVTSHVQDYEYGYRQGVVMDPFGHQWLIQKRI